MKTDSYAQTAVFSLPDSNGVDVNLFEDFQNRDVITPVGRVADYPIYRSDDIDRKNNCYLGSGGHQPIDWNL